MSQPQNMLNSRLTRLHLCWEEQQQQEILPLYQIWQKWNILLPRNEKSWHPTYVQELLLNILLNPELMYWRVLFFFALCVWISVEDLLLHSVRIWIGLMRR